MKSDNDYDLGSMREAVKNCDKNIKIFEDAIFKEMNTKMEYQRIIRFLEEKEAAKKEAEKNVKLEIVKVDDIDDP